MVHSKEGDGMDHVLEVRDLETVFRVNGKDAAAVDRVSFHLDKGEIVGVVGESGSGKSVAMMSLLKLISAPGRIVGGDVRIDGVDGNVLEFPDPSKKLLNVRGSQIGMVFQEPMTSLNPVLSVGYKIRESILYHTKMTKAEAKKEAIKLMEQVGIPDASTRYNSYPQQFSGGMRQRIMIAIALAAKPQILIADEATTALDVTTQAQLLDLMQSLAEQTGISVIIVTHNLGIVARYAKRIYVMYGGRIMETANTERIFSNPTHPYTRKLLKVVPRLSDRRDRKLIPIEGTPPSIENKPAYCAFYGRCPYRVDACMAGKPDLKEVEPGHEYACYRTVEELEEQDRILALQEQASAPQRDVGEEVILDVQNVSKTFPVLRGVLQREVGVVHAVNSVSFTLHKGETLGIVGESGCGKTTLSRVIIHGYRADSGKVIFEGKDLPSASDQELRPYRSKISMIFQDPFSSLDPRQSIGSIVGEPLLIHKLVANSQEYDDRVTELLELVGLDPTMRDRKPHEFSGGQRQRLGIARALASNPSVIICDEPISALDVSIQAQIINLLEDLQRRMGIAYIFVSHDLAVAKHISNRIMVMYLGTVVEYAESEDLYDHPMHPYTQALLSAVPVADPGIDKSRERIKLCGSVPSVMNRPSGCPFSDRCPQAQERCKKEQPSLQDHGNGHLVACFL